MRRNVILGVAAACLVVAAAAVALLGDDDPDAASRDVADAAPSGVGVEPRRVDPAGVVDGREPLTDAERAQRDLAAEQKRLAKLTEKLEELRADEASIREIPDSDRGVQTVVKHIARLEERIAESKAKIAKLEGQ